MQELLNLLNKYKLTANQLVLIHSMSENTRCSDLVPAINAEILLAKQKGLIDNQNGLLPKSIMILGEAEKLFKVTKTTKSNLYNKPDFMEKLHEYREIFPNRKLPSGKAARTNIEDLKKRMAEFFIKYPYYDWDTVLDATTHYVETYSKTEYKFMKTAGYYIVKDGESDLATDCELLLDGGHEPLIKNSHYTIS